MAAKRIKALFLIMLLLPWFMPEVRDLMWRHNQKYGFQDRIARFTDEAEGASAPVTAALVRHARRLVSAAEMGKPQITIMVNGKPVTVRTHLGPAPADDDFSLMVEHPTLDAGMVEAVLAEAGSPAAGTGLGELSVQQARETGIDNAYWLAMFLHESGLGAAPGWAGNKGDGHYTGNTGNIICHDGHACYGRFTDYGDDWQAGTRDHFQLLKEYREGKGELWNGEQHATIREAIATWAPAEDSNDPNSYASFIEEQTRTWRQVRRNVVEDAKKEEQPPQAPPAQANTQGAVEPWPGFTASECAGFHAGARDYCKPEGTEVRAPVSGTFLQTGRYTDELRFGDYFMFLDDQGREWYFGHLKNVTPMEAGQRVEPGMKLGELGPFSYSTPHTHLQFRVDGALTDPGPVLGELGL